MTNIKTEPYVTQIKAELEDIKCNLPPMPNIESSSKNDGNSTTILNSRHNTSDLKMLKNRITSLEEKLENITKQNKFVRQRQNFRPHFRNKNNFRGVVKLSDSDFHNLQQNIKAAMCGSLKKDIINECREQFKIHESNASASSIFVGIWDTTPISYDRLVELKRSIIIKIMKEPIKDEVPCFNGFEYKSGWLLVICKDFKTLLWVHKNIPLLKPWYNAKLDVRRCVNLPKTNRIVLHAPSSEADTPHEAMTLLKTQNSSLNIDMWEIINVVYEVENFEVYFNVSDDCLDELNKLNYKPFFGLKKALVEIVPEKKMDVCDVVELSD